MIARRPDASATTRWFEPLLERLRTLRKHPDPRLWGFFEPDVPLVAARAPGRLDVMGGIADYSGALVLELPLGRATYVVLQHQPEARCDLASLRGERADFFRLELAELQTGALRSPEAIRAYFADRPADGWAAYVVGLIHYVLHRLEPAPAAPSGFRLLIASDVPEGKGVSSSAALEVAAMTAITGGYGIEMAPEALAAACQWVENHVVGAPCGIMDQMTCALGWADHLLRLRCQPAVVEGHVAIPPGYRFFGIDSGIRHAVSGADYGTVRTAAFMGYRMLAEAAGLPAAPVGDMVRVEDSIWRGYLANLTPPDFEHRFRDLLPDRMRGRAFLDRYGGTTDPVTRVDPARVYPVRQATRHPVYENARVERFAELLDELARPGVAASHREALAVEMGQAMFASHASYSACGLGSDGTDWLVERVRALGPEQGLFGAKITGGGSGGTVAIFGRREAAATVQALAAQYRSETGRVAEVFTHSSPGSAETGLLRLDGIPPAGSGGDRPEGV